jgi:subtilisin family serine protease
MVKAPEFWSAYGKQGENFKVCVIDTGLLSLHEDIRDGDLSGSFDDDLVTPWFEDRNSHGTHVAGTLAAVDNNKRAWLVWLPRSRFTWLKVRYIKEDN